MLVTATLFHVITLFLKMDCFLLDNERISLDLCKGVKIFMVLTCG